MKPIKWLNKENATHLKRENSQKTIIAVFGRLNDAINRFFLL